MPLPGTSFGGDTSRPEIAIYRPTDRYVYWTRLDGTASGQFYTRFEDGIVLLPGLYDSDNKTDLVSYNPANARFFMLRSMLNWDHYQGIPRYFDVTLRPDAVGATDAGTSAPAVRHGGIALPAQSAGRRVLRVWDAYTGYWYTMWDPINSSAVQSCPWGGPRDVPLAPIDVNARSVMSAVPDMKGSDDGLSDVLVLDPDQSTWTRYYSHVSASFTQQSVLSLGNVGAMGL